MSSFYRYVWQFGLLCLLTTGVGQAFADGPAFPSSWIRLAQKPESSPSESPKTRSKPHAAHSSDDDADDEPAKTEAIAHDEQQTALLNLLAANLADAEQRNKAHQQEKRDWEAKLEKLSNDGLAEPPPYSFLDLDKARDEYASERQNANSIADAVTRGKESVTRAAEEQSSRERDLRHAKDDLEHNTNAGAIAALTQDVTDAEHDLAVAGQVLALRKAELANLQLDQQVQALRQQYAKLLVEIYEPHAAFTSEMQNKVLSELDARGKTAAARAKQLTDDLSKFLQPQWYQAREKLDNSRATEDETKLAALAAEVQAKDLAQQLADFEISINVAKLDRINDLHMAWKRRYAVANSLNSAAEAVTWLEETKAASERLRADTATLRAKTESVQRQLDANEKKLQSADKADTSRRYWLGKTSESLEQERRLSERALAELEPARRVFEKLENELTGDTISATAIRWLAEARKDIELVWDYEVANVQDRPITIGRIVKGVFLFVLGIYASRFLSRAFGRRLLSRMGVNASASSAFQSLAFYLLVLLFTLFALKLVEVPLTAFTVLGGAVALGVGFGSQNIVNNFISGLILLVERPVKVGDLIQLENIYGNVEHIGARSTRVKTGENMDIIVPNSTFLETNVVNWTLSDNNMRTHVAFGVAYGSPTGKVAHLALKAAANHDRVFERPAPFVIFNNFGDNSLEFELHFWVSVRTVMERRQIESDIRFNIEHLFSESGIVIAFPQRDVHLTTEKPIRVQMTPAVEEGEAA